MTDLMNQKKHNYMRSKKLLDSANGQECTLNSPVCNHDSETTVFSHLDEYFAGKGRGIKASDIAGFYACSSCHEAYANLHLNLDIDHWMVLRAYYRTINQMIEDGVIKIK